MTCKKCSTNEEISRNWFGDCSVCGKLRWSPNGINLFPIPGFTNNSPPIIESTDLSQSILSSLENSKLTRMPSADRYNGKRNIESIEILTGIDAHSLSNKRLINDRFKVFRNFFQKFGLDLIPLIGSKKESKIEHIEPLLIFKQNNQPFSSFLNIDKSSEYPIIPHSLEDPNIASYKTHINFHAADIFSQDFREEQEKAIKQILRYTGSKQVISLPTGYGKTRIIQTVTNILRTHDKGPTLMISPIIALRDDQREAFTKDLKKTKKDFNCSFLTPHEDDEDDIIQDLLNNNLDLLCCSPEHLMTPGYNMSWLEIFSRMKVPFSTLVVDEAHLIGDWGASIRPDFILLGELKDRLLEMNSELRVILQSATITKNEKEELAKLFDGLYELEDIEVKGTRPDLFFRVDLEVPSLNNIVKPTINYEQNVNVVSKIYEEMPGKWYSTFDDSDDKGRSPLLIYSAYKVVAEERIKPALELFGFKNVKTYTAETTLKNNRRLEFKNNKIDAMVATSAFGMGIDKPDVWVISYLGLPFTLKALYQGFGRAARGSNWDRKKIDFPVRGGVCLATIPDKKLKPFKPELRIKLAAERLWALFDLKETVFFPKEGYIIAPSLDGLNTPLWYQKELDLKDYVNQSEDDLDLGNWSYKKGSDNFDRAKQKQKFSNLSFRMWSLSCLQRNKTISIMGFFPKILCQERTTGEKWTLEETVRNGGYNEVLQVMKTIDHKNFITTPPNQQRMLLIKVNKKIFSWSDLLKHLQDGHNSLRERHIKGNNELKRFFKMVKNKDCLRKSFAPAIGMDIKQSKSCSELIEAYLKNNKNDELPVIPCFFCAKSNFPHLLDENNVIWGSDDINNEIQNKLAIPNSKSIYDPDWNIPDHFEILPVSKDENGENKEIVIPVNADFEIIDDSGVLMDKSQFNFHSGIIKFSNHIPRDTSGLFVFREKITKIRFQDSMWNDMFDY